MVSVNVQLEHIIIKIRFLAIHVLAQYHIVKNVILLFYVLNVRLQFRLQMIHQQVEHIVVAQQDIIW
jgi:hypothetical protein